MAAEEAIFKLAVDWLSRLAKASKELRKKHAAALVKLSDEFGAVEDLVRFYVEPECQQINPADKDEDEAISIVRSAVFRTLEEFFSGVIRARTGEHQMFILGDAGMGKTSLLVMLKLAHLRSFWPSSYKCELMRINKEANARIDAIEDKPHTILLLDSVDEDPLAWDSAGQRLEELLTATVSFRRVVITCRTQFFPKASSLNSLERHGYVSLGPFSCPSLYLSPFRDAQVEAYLAKRFPRTIWQWLFHRDSPRRVHARQVVHLMKSLRMRPMLLSYLDQLMYAEQTLDSSYGVYTALTDYWLRREEIRAKEQRRSAVTADSLWRTCREIAFYLNRTGRQDISGEDLLRVAGPNLDIQADARLGYQLEMMDFGGRSLLNRTSEGAYRFAHLSIQSFILAHGLLTNITPNPSKVVQGDPDVAFFLASANRTNRGRRVSGVTFHGTSFSQLDLSEAAFDCCTFRQVPFRGTKLTGSRFSGCHFIRCDFSDADFSNAAIDGTISNCLFTGANLTGTNMERVTLVGKLDDKIHTGAGTILPVLRSEMTPVDRRALAELDEPPPGTLASRS